MPEVVLGPDGEPLADWEIDLLRAGEAPAEPAATPAAATDARRTRLARAGDQHGDDEQGDDDDAAGDGQDGSGRREPQQPPPSSPPEQERRGDGPAGHPTASTRPATAAATPARTPAAAPIVPSATRRPSRSARSPCRCPATSTCATRATASCASNGYLASRDDAYIPVKLTRQYGLRKGDHVTGLSRPAGRNEKNPALLEIHTVNGGDPEKAKNRKRFEDLTALFPDEKLRLENPLDPNNMTARIIDLISPIGKGQRGIIVSPPKAGKTTVMKTIATSIEQNHPEVKLIVLLIDERPEEVTDMRRTVKGEVIASTFDRPSDEHTHVAELAIEKAKRLVEQGDDVVIILDGITRLSRAYNLAAPASGRILSGGIDAGALYPPKKFFGAARNVEEGGSLTILATALVETNSRMDDAIFEEFKGTGNMELRLDRKLAERRIYPAIDVDASSTRHEELLFDRKQLQMVWKLRRVLSGLAADGNAAPGLELLVDRLKTFRTNDEFLNEIAKQPSM